MDKISSKKKLIIYLDDSEKPAQAFAVVEELTDSIITFKTEFNRITIPVSRLLKIKEDLK